MWTDTTRVLYVRKGMALPSDLTEGAWAVLEPVLPPASRFGRPRKWPLRRLVDAMFYLRGGLPWRMLPQDFPPMTGAALFLRVARLWPVAEDQRHPLGRVALGRGVQGQPQCRRDRQPKRQNPRAANPRKAGEFAAMTRAKRSRAGSAIS